MRAFSFILILVAMDIDAAAVIAGDEFDEAKAISKIELLDGKIERDNNLPGNPAVGLSLEGNQRFGDGYVYLLKALPNLRRLDLSGSRITDEGLKQLAELQSLVELNLYDTSTTRAAMSELREKLPKAWIVDDFMITNLGGGFRRDGGRHINSVSFAGSQKFGDDEMRLLKPLRHVEILELQDTRITDKGLKELKEHKHLKTLRLGGNQITDSGLKEIAVHTQLVHLFLNDTPITDDGLVELRRLQNLTQLNLSGVGISDNGLKSVSELRELLILDLSSTPISDAGLKELADLPKLTTLMLTNCKITDRGLTEIKKLNYLGVLHLRGTQITDTGLNEFKEFKSLRSVFLGNTQVTDRAFDELKSSGLIRQVEK